MPRRSSYLSIPKEKILDKFHEEYLRLNQGFEDMMKDMKHCDLYFIKDTNQTFVYGMTKVGPITFCDYDSIDWTLESDTDGMMPAGQHIRELDEIDMTHDLGICSDAWADRFAEIDKLVYNRNEMKYTGLRLIDYVGWLSDRGYSGGSTAIRDWHRFYKDIYLPALKKFTGYQRYAFNINDWEYPEGSDEEVEQDDYIPDDDKEDYFGEVMFPIVPNHYTGYLHNTALLFPNGWRPHIKNDTMKFDWTYVAITYRTIKTIVGGMVSFGGVIPGLGVPIAIGQMVFSFTFWLYPMKPNLSFSNEFSKNLRTPSDDLREVMEKLTDTKAAGIYFNDKFKIKRGWGMFEGWTLRLEGNDKEIVLYEWDPRRKKTHKIKYKYSHPIPMNIIEKYYEGTLKNSRIDKLAKLILPEMIGGIQHNRNKIRRQDATEELQLYD